MTATETENTVTHLFAIENPRRELAHRTADGIEVTLLWDSGDDTVTVEVFDAGTEEIFEIDVARDRALDAFHHPFAYAA
jgi:hypothetical protein